jgi:hypothetical protein
MTFRDAVNTVPAVSSYFKEGLGCVEKANHSKFCTNAGINWKGGVNIDHALGKQKLHCQSNRWDYAIGYLLEGESEKLVFVEIHGDKINDIFRKQEWLEEWLKSEAPALLTMPHPTCPYVWVVTNGVGFRSGSMKMKKLAIRGIKVAKMVKKEHLN